MDRGGFTPARSNLIGGPAGLAARGGEDTAAAVHVAVEGLKLLIEEDRRNGR